MAERRADLTPPEIVPAPAYFAIPGDLSAPTGGYVYARRVLRELPELTHLALPNGFPLPSPSDLAAASAVLAAVPPDAVLLIDGLALGALPGRCLDAVRTPVVALVHHPLCLETGIADHARAALRASERLALSRVARVVATSASTADLLARDFGVPEARLSIAEPGTDPAPLAPRTGAPPHLLAVGAVVPRKGYAMLIRALAALRHLPWTLTIAGTLDRDAATAACIRTVIAEYGLADRVALAGEVAPAVLDTLYNAADVFVIASLHEGYGMAAAEAMARGLPLVASTAGALATTIPDGAALKYPAGDVAGLCAALHRMLTDTPCRTACADAVREAGNRLPRWDRTARRIAEALVAARRGFKPAAA